MSITHRALFLSLVLSGCMSAANNVTEDTMGNGTPSNSIDDGTDNETSPTTDTETSSWTTNTTSTPPGATRFVGEFEITVITDWGEDVCAGNLSMDFAREISWDVYGTGSCSFDILGSQSAVFDAVASENGDINGLVDLEAFGSPFQLEWEGDWTDELISCDHSGTTELEMVGSTDYRVVFEAIAQEPDTDTGTTGTTPGTTVDPGAVDFSAAGVGSYSLDSDTFTSSDGCTMDFKTYTPSGTAADLGWVVLVHGYTRSLEQMVGWGEHLASWGIPTVLTNVCHSSAFDVDLDQNAVDVVELMDEIGSGPLIYAGHSNGAISALVAAAMDENAIAIFGLDAVEAFGSNHEDEAAAFGLPVVSLFGEESTCNAWNSGLSTYVSANDSLALRVTEADHCDFEDPTDSWCTSVCTGSNDQFTDVEIVSTIRNLTTAFFAWQLLGDPDGEAWWDGSNHNALLNEGSISEL